MFKEIKLNGRNMLFCNYKFIILPSLMFMTSNYTINIILNYFTNSHIWFALTNFLQLLILFLFLIIEFIIIPVSLALMFKIIILCDKGKIETKGIIKNFLKLSNIKKIILINFLPRLLDGFFATNNSRGSVWNIFKIDGIFLIVLSILSVIVSYKFFACNYIFALEEASVKQTIGSSFKVMKNNFIKWILLPISYCPWVFLIVIIFLLFKMAICGYSLNEISLVLNTYTPFLDSLNSFGFGVGLYLIPYMYCTMYNFIKKNENKNDKKTR